MAQSWTPLSPVIQSRSVANYAARLLPSGTHHSRNRGLQPTCASPRRTTGYHRDTSGERSGRNRVALWIRERTRIATSTPGSERRGLATCVEAVDSRIKRLAGLRYKPHVAISIRCRTPEITPQPTASSFYHRKVRFDTANNDSARSSGSTSAIVSIRVTRDSDTSVYRLSSVFALSGRSIGPASVSLGVCRRCLHDLVTPQLTAY